MQNKEKWIRMTQKKKKKRNGSGIWFEKHQEQHDFEALANHRAKNSGTGMAVQSDAGDRQQQGPGGLCGLG